MDAMMGGGDFTPNPKHLDGVADMSNLIYLEAPHILHNVRVRYKKQEIYTSISKVLLAINPYEVPQALRKEC